MNEGIKIEFAEMSHRISLTLSSLEEALIEKQKEIDKLRRLLQLEQAEHKSSLQTVSNLSRDYRNLKIKTRNEPYL